MNLYLLMQFAVNSYGSYDSLVVIAPDEETARLIHPSIGNYEPNLDRWKLFANSWCLSPEYVDVTLLGTAKEGSTISIVLTSLNAV